MKPVLVSVQVLKAFAGIDERTHCIKREERHWSCRCGKTFERSSTAKEHVDEVGIYGPIKVCAVEDCNTAVPGAYSDEHCDAHWYEMEMVE